MNINFNFFDYSKRCSPPPRPKKPTLGEKIQMGDSMAQFGVRFGLPVSGASDVATRELTITVNGVDPPVLQTLTAGSLLSDQVVFNDGDNYSVSLVDIDAHGNRSPASAALVGVVVDSIPPPMPNMVNVAEVVQID